MTRNRVLALHNMFISVHKGNPAPQKPASSDPPLHQDPSAAAKQDTMTSQKVIFRHKTPIYGLPIDVDRATSRGSSQLTITNKALVAGVVNQKLEIRFLVLKLKTGFMSLATGF